MILPPVFSRAERAALRAGRRAGSGFLMLRKRSGRAVRRDSITVLRGEQLACKWDTVGLHVPGFVGIDEKTFIERNERVLNVGHDQHLSLIQVWLSFTSQHSSAANLGTGHKLTFRL